VKGLKIGIIVVCLCSAVAIAMFTWGRESEATVDVSGFESTFKCESCGQQFELTSKEYEAEVVRCNGGEPFHCKSCSERAAWMVIQCSECKNWFFGPLKPGSTGACPVCHPDRAIEDDSDEPDPVTGEPRIIHGY
jgi:hypothetical protein